MTKHMDNAVPTTSELHGDELLPDAVLTLAEPKRSGENIGASIERRPAERKRKTAGADDSRAAGQKVAGRGQTKTEIVVKRLRSSKGVSVSQLCEATGWQAHSVRGFLSAVVKKKLCLTLVSEVGKDGARRYRVEGARAGQGDLAR